MADRFGISVRDEIVRTLRLLHLLLGDDGLTSIDLAARLDVHPRTVARDIARLRAVGVDIVWRRRKGSVGGYEVTGIAPRLRALLEGDAEAFPPRTDTRVPCARCGREIVVARGKRYCSREDDIACWRARQAETWRRSYHRRRADGRGRPAGTVDEAGNDGAN